MEDQENSKATIENFYKVTKDCGFETVGDFEIPTESVIKRPATYNLLIDLEAQIVGLKYSLEDWREIVLPIYSVLLWEKNWYPGAIIGATSFLFLSLWVLDPSILTTISILGLTVTISDYIVPLLASAFFKADSWTGTKEKTFHEMSKNVIIYKAKVQASCTAFYNMRTTRPKMYYGCTIFTMVLLAWVGNGFNNLFLTYILITIILLIPGMEHHGILHKYGSVLTQKLSDCTKMKSSEAKKEQ